MVVKFIIFPYICRVMSRYIDIHTHHPTNRHRELKAEGRHPWNAESTEEIFISPAAEAVGEIGLDFACTVDRIKQEEVFSEQLAIAQKRGVAVVVHCVKAFEQIMKILDSYSLHAVIFHGFIGSPQQAQKAVEKGYYLSFGERCVKSPKTTEALRITPLDRIFVETDESPTPIEQIYTTIASLKGATEAELIDAIENNYNRIFQQQ